MLSFSKEREPDLAPAQLNEVVAEVIELMQARAAELNVSLNWNPDGAMPLVPLDSDAIHKAVLNVLTNAVDACEERPAGRVDVSTRHLADQHLVQVIVEDNGVGISAEQLPKIFQVFVSDKGTRGTGLGLPVSQKIIKEHGGRIAVDSEVGRGSRFVLEFPTTVSEVARDSGIAAKETHVGGTVDDVTQAG
ncbi:MAG TPA: ATP-binding protein, partial [Pirellulales bacterium]|nr:ATP-binding protein [Pirellulales bacterium]